MVRHDVDGHVERRILAPPAVPVLAFPRPRIAAEHVASHHVRADVPLSFFDDARAGVDFPAIHPVRFAEGGGGKRPAVQALATNPQWIFEALVRPGHEPLERYRDVEPENTHGSLPFAIWVGRLRVAGADLSAA